MEILESILLVVLLVSALFIIVAVMLQKSSDEGLSGTIAGNSDTFYGKDKSSHSERTLFICTVIAAILFIVAVFAVYVLQPDYTGTNPINDWLDVPDSYTEIYKQYGLEDYYSPSHINKYVSYFK